MIRSTFILYDFALDGFYSYVTMLCDYALDGFFIFSFEWIRDDWINWMQVQVIKFFKT